MSASVIPCTPIGEPDWLVLMWFSWLSSVPRRGSELDLAVVHRLGRSGHDDRRVAAGPFDGERAAARRDVDARVEQSEPDADRDRGAGARAAGERLARAALVHAQTDGRARDDLQEAGVDAAREADVLL